MQQIELELAGGGVLTVSLRASLDAMPAVKQRPLVLVVPGGGYNHVSPREGDPVALQFAAAGYHTAVLRYAALSAAVLDIPGETAQQRPNAVILGYPVITAGEFAHRGSFVQLAGSEDAAAQQAFTLEDKVTSDTPPVFVWHTMEDKTVPVENTLLLLAALRRAGVPCEAHLFEKGAHGTSISTAEVDAADPHRAHWVALCLEWLGETFGFKLS